MLSLGSMTNCNNALLESINLNAMMLFKMHNEYPLLLFKMQNK